MTEQQMTSQQESTGGELKNGLIIIGSFVAIFWGLEVIDWVLGHSLDKYGIRPRSTDGLSGILWAPFLHGGWDHLSANTIPFAVLGFLTMLRGSKVFFAATAIIALVAGVGTWLTGASNSVHIGASSLIFGYFGFLVLAGLLERSLKGILIAVIVGFVYGGIIGGVLPQQEGISWQGHLFGFIGGLVASYMLCRKRPVQTESPAQPTSPF
jgi:membrane associated rhomboid family serine protease